MTFFELEPADIANLNDSDLRELVGRLCEAELIRQNLSISPVHWGGAQEAPDGGLDVNVIDAVDVDMSGFIPRANTGFQVKRNKMSKAQCSKEMLHQSELKPVIKELADKKGGYIIVSGKDNCSDGMRKSRLQGMYAALAKLNNKDDLKLDFYCGHRLCTWLKQFPAVALWARSKLNKPLDGWRSFGRWAATPLKQDDEFLQDAHPCISDLSSNDRDPKPIADGIRLVRDKLRPQGTSVRITGLSGVGKTRFAQALFENSVGEDALPKENVVYADLGDDLAPSATDVVSYFIHQSLNCYLVLDNCPPEQHRRFQKQLSASPSKVHLLTIEYDISDDTPEGTDVVRVEPSSEKTVSKLVQKRYPNLPERDAARIAEFAGGNARIAIALASRVTADESLANFTDDALFKRLFFQRKGESEHLLESAEMLSLVYSFNIATDRFHNELEVLAQIGEVKRKTLYRCQAELLSRQVAQKRGDWRAVLPHAIANRLAKRALKSISLEQINIHLFKPENHRLLKSCAHRLGYLHDCEDAKALLASWFGDIGPFQNLAHCKESYLKALDYFAPVCPEIVLCGIEQAAETPGFCSRANKCFSMIVRLLRKIAYDEIYFDRAVLQILRFAETENENEKSDPIADRLASLFSLYLSGTNALPETRQSFINLYLDFSKPEHAGIIRKVYRSAFNAGRWTSFEGFNFGAQVRGYGWTPKTDEEVFRWYKGFLETLLPHLSSKNESVQALSKEMIVNHFRSLWSFSGCFVELEAITHEHACNGNWSELWLAIKKTIRLDEKRMSCNVLGRLRQLEKLAAPTDLLSQINAFVFNEIRDHVDFRNSQDEENSYQQIESKIVALGEIAASKPDLLKYLAPRLWEKHIYSLWSFGKGIANGAADKTAMFDDLVHLLQEQNPESIHPIVFSGFLSSVYCEAPDLAKELHRSTLDIPELKPFFVTFLEPTAITSFDIDKMIELAQNCELLASDFEKLTYPRTFKDIPDNKLAILLTAISHLDYGEYMSLDILSMRFYDMEKTGYIPEESLKIVARDCIVRWITLGRNIERQRIQFSAENVLKVCLQEPVSKSEVTKIVNALCDGIESYQFSSFDREGIVSSLMKYQPECLLDRVNKDNTWNDELAFLLFVDLNELFEAPLNTAPIERVLGWCNEEQNKIQKIAAFINPFEIKEQVTQANSLSKQVFALLEAATDKCAVVETIFSNVAPNGWSGSLAAILQRRYDALTVLLNHSSKAVNQTAKTKLKELERLIAESRADEAKRIRRGEQSFE